MVNRSRLLYIEKICFLRINIVITTTFSVKLEEMNPLRSVKVRLYLRVLGALNMQAYANHVHLYCMSPTAVVEYIESQFYILLYTLV